MRVFGRIICAATILAALCGTAMAEVATVTPGVQNRLNNLVIELGAWDLTGPDIARFNNPRDGWVFVSVTPTTKRRTALSLNAASGGTPICIDAAMPVAESMHYLKAGDYSLSFDEPKSRRASVIVRAIPELQYCRFPTELKIKEFGEIDWAFLEKYVLPNVNTIVGNPDPAIDDRISEWTHRGLKWIGYSSLPKEEGLTPQQAYKYWAAEPGFQDPRLEGIISDEFQGRHNPYYPAWTAGMQLLGESHVADGRAFYGYCGGPGMYSRPQSRALVRTVFDNGFYMAYERYHHEEPTLDAMIALMDRLLGAEMPKWRETFPGCERKIVMVMGLFSQGMGLNVHPNVDFKVHMDVQMQYLATHPAFEDIFGIHWWVANYADDELIRWLGQLYRHYAIEGNTNLLSDRYGFEYEMNHIANPDFFDGVEGWSIDSAGPDTVRADYMEWYARMQGRYWHRAGFPDEPAGNTFLWMKRQSNKPNVATQAIRGLHAGELYSANMISADYGDISEGVSDKKMLDVVLKIDGADIIPQKCFQGVYDGRNAEPFLDKSAYFNYHRVVFRATSDAAVLSITDWPNDSAPAASVGRETMVNFIEVQPYFAGVLTTDKHR